MQSHKTLYLVIAFLAIATGYLLVKDFCRTRVEGMTDNIGFNNFVHYISTKYMIIEDLVRAIDEGRQYTLNCPLNVIGDLKTSGPATIENTYIGAWRHDKDDGVSQQYACIRHADLPVTDKSYSLLSGNDGNTFINATGDKSVHLRRDNTDLLTINREKCIVTPPAQIENTYIGAWRYTIGENTTANQRYACIRHKNLPVAPNSYSLLSDEQGDTFVNATGNNKSVYLRNNNEDLQQINKSTCTIKPSAIIDNAYIGAWNHYNTKRNRDFAVFSHVNRSDTNSNDTYSFLSHKNGSTYMNAPSGSTLHARIDNSDRAKWN